jgi:hypothetical protein
MKVGVHRALTSLALTVLTVAACHTVLASTTSSSKTEPVAMARVRQAVGQAEWQPLEDLWHRQPLHLRVLLDDLCELLIEPRLRHTKCLARLAHLRRDAAKRRAHRQKKQKKSVAVPSRCANA